jgi:dihydrodipicolinate synthase/N-acetylneuraminate lyase
MDPQTVASLAAEFPNFVLFKDTSGLDRVARSGLDFGGVNFVRGSEQGGYAKWTRAVGGPYDGFLLSTANVLAPELNRVLHLMDLGDSLGAEKLSLELEGLVSSVFAIVQNYSVGNAFANANKLMYHFRSNRQSFSTTPAPMLYCGERLPWEFIERTFELVNSKYQWLLQ